MLQNRCRLSIFILMFVIIAAIVYVIISVTGNPGLSKLTDIDTKGSGNIKDNLPKEILSDIGKNRAIVKDTEEELISKFEKTFLYNYDVVPESVKYIDERSGENAGTAGMPAFIDKQSAIADIEYLFDCLKYGYAGYKYFGGDEAFSKAKQNITDKINAFKTDIPAGFLEDTILESLGFIQDGHFSIGRNALIKDYNMFMSERYEIAKEGSIYYLIDNGNKKRIVSIDNEAPENCIKPSIDKNGYAIYRFCLLRQSRDKELAVQVNLENDSLKAILPNVTLSYERNKAAEVYSRKKYYNVPVIKLTSFIPSEELEAFEKDAKDLKDEDLLIIDLRGNSGGNSKYADNWLESFTGVKNEGIFISAALNTDLALKAFLHTVKNTYEEKYFLEIEKIVKDEYGSIPEKYKYWRIFDYSLAKRIRNEIPIFVLIDMKTASAAEIFINKLSYLENTYFIGTNSSGAGDIGNVAKYMLPRSGIEVSFGSLLIINPDLKMRDGLGFQPDFWVASKDMEERVIRFIGNYSANN